MKRKCPDWQERLTRSVVMERYYRDLARQSGLELTVSLVRSGRTEFPHWTFRLPSGRHLVQYWPTSGKVWVLSDGRRLRVEESWEALEFALEERDKLRVTP